MKPAIVFMINSLAGGGAEKVIALLLANSRPWSARFDIHAVLLDEEEQAYVLPDWVCVHRLDTGRSLARGVFRAGRLLRRLRPAICLSFLTRANIVNVVTAQVGGHRAVISERVNASSHHPHTLAGRVARLATRLFYPRADIVICPSAGVASDLIANFGVDRSRTRIIHNPVDIDAITQAAGAAGSVTQPYFVAVGRLVENKNFSMLIDAFAAARTGHDLVILGEGPLRASLEGEVRSLGLEGRVHLPGFVAYPFAVLRDAHAFILSSNAEGFPNALAEALALGVPVIATNCRSGPSEILANTSDLHVRDVHHARHGILVPVGDTAAMARALKEMSDPGTRGSHAANARTRAAAFGLAPAVAAYWSVLEGTHE
jgi:glycosyltransferase involved in cell wall biosynthesis